GNQQQSLSNVLCLPYTAVIWIPNAFSPNADGLNDTFSIKGISIRDFNLRVFDRWGSKIFESNSIYEGWDGKAGDRICPAGIYSFQLNIRLQDGKNLFHSGTIHLIR
ncbi:MAG: gliding motility-associated C-terminal domain-containing protein, partial [Sphingobacteriales bacterium]|nr:gliding motility-associated C-terminal domain-containing protein [Sphingobacteriales bacterium]